MIYKEELQQIKRNKIETLLKKNDYPDDLANFFRYSSVKSQTCLLGYFSSINNFLNWCVAENIFNNYKDIGDVKPSHVTKYLTGLIESNYKNSTVVTIQNQLSSFFNYLVEEDIIVKSPILKRNRRLFQLKKKKDMAKLPKKEDLDVLSNSLNEIANVNSRIKYSTIYRVLLGSGLRESELCGLDMNDLHLEYNYPYVEVIRKGAYSELEYETVYISNDACEALKEWLEIRNKIQAVSNAVFLTREGLRIKEKNIIRIIKKYSNNTITPHMLRHLYVTNLYHATNDLAFVQEQAGHVQGSSVTLDTYAAGSNESRKLLLNL